MDKASALAALTQEMRMAQDAPLRDYRMAKGNQLVPGTGNPNARVMFVGESPGYNEARRGLPFIGVSGQYLDVLLGSIGLKRSDVFITNILKDRPPENRAPWKSEIAYYAPYLDRQIAIIQPRVIVALGRFALEHLTMRYAPDYRDAHVSDVHGEVFDGRTPYGPIRIVSLYHPAVALYDETKRTTLEQDFHALRIALDSIDRSQSLMS